MASKNAVSKSEEYFALILMKHAYQYYCLDLPSVLRQELKKIDRDNPMLVTDNMKRAMRFILGNIFKDDTQQHDIGSQEYNDALYRLRYFYDHEDLFKFITFYAAKAALGHHDYMGLRVYIDITDILKARTCISESWIEIDEIAKEILKEEEVVERFRHLGTFVDTTEEEEFLLRFIDYVFLLHFVALPENLESRVSELDPPHETNPFTNNVTRAIAILLNSDVDVSDRVGEENLRTFYHESVSKSFEHRTFFECCVFFSRKALVEYLYYEIYDTPKEVYDTMVRIIERAKEQKEFTSWDGIEKTAVQIIEEDAQRIENENQRQEFLNRPESRDIAYCDNEPLKKTSNLLDSLEKSLKIEDNAQNIENKYLQLLKDKSEETNQSTKNSKADSHDEKTESNDSSKKSSENNFEQLENLMENSTRSLVQVSLKIPVVERVKDESYKDEQNNNKKYNKTACSCCKCS